MPITTQSAYAADNQPSAPRQFPAGQEKAKNTDAATVKVQADETERGK